MKDNTRLKLQISSQGWEQFLTSRKEMLDAFDRARTQSRKHKVETFHGNVAEAEFRKWLANFLPKKYAVTSGYIISQGVADSVKLPHFDVIIYEHLEAPILWIENNPDSSEQGRSLAIPAEYVKSVIEVKSAFKKATVKDAIEHLAELKDLMKATDLPNERYKMYLPPDFFCAIAFFELRKENEKNIKAINELANTLNLRGFYGGVILRGEGLKTELTGNIKMLQIDKELKPNINKTKSLLNSHTIVNLEIINEDINFGAMLSWSPMNFSQFSFDIVSLLNGSYENGRLSSFYGFGTSNKIESNW
tara:strand:- start:448 stop:1362 length:915 start_codon:yes stop_codon:yes gene_type:complete